VGEPEDDTVIAPPRDLRPDADDVLTGDTILVGRTDVPDAGAPRPAASVPRTPAPVDAAPAAPARARVQVNRARPFELTAPVIVGRRPSPPRVPGRETPLLVAVPSPTQEVSGSHLEIRQQGTTVVITDLRSTNGSVITAPGRAAVTLRQGDAIVVVPGTVIDVGDGNLLEILPAARLQPAQHHGKA
jgi:pSer/pThr/pTyr-binding forkhead associated (FHA) protein